MRAFGLTWVRVLAFLSGVGVVALGVTLSLGGREDLLLIVLVVLSTVSLLVLVKTNLNLGRKVQLATTKARAAAASADTVVRTAADRQWMSSCLEEVLDRRPGWLQQSVRAEVLSSEERLSAQIQAHLRQEYRQLEALQALYAVLRPRYPLPPMRGWAGSPDFQLQLVMLVRTHRPDVIVECGSGVSTLCLGYALQQNGSGQLVSLEDHSGQASVSRQLAKDSGLSDVVEIVDAPLVPTTLGGGQWHWYDRSATARLPPCDMLVVDGPRGKLQPMSRYPALPLLADRLGTGSVVILDDAKREEEQEILRRWKREHPEFRQEYLRTEKGTAILRRVPG